ncbi:MAG TPA: PKD domain-containing protein, partial [Cytophagaceae bacterium]
VDIIYVNEIKSMKEKFTSNAMDIKRRGTITLITFALILSYLNGYSQKEAYIWYFGRKAGLDFNTTPPTMLSNGPNPGTGDTDEAHATISDADGNLLFYTNGQTIWNKNLAVMPNGTGLSGHWSTTQCATVFPLPGSTTEYFIITTPLTGSTTGLLYSVVDMNAAGGLGDIKAPVASHKNQPMPNCPTYMMESVVSVPHSNGIDIWVIAHTADNPGTANNEGGSFVVWLVTSSGISYSNTYTLGYAYPASASGSRGIGIMKSNSCFTRIFISYYNASSRVEGFSFNNSTGVVGNWPAPVSGPLVIDEYRNSSGVMTPIGSFSYGLEISPNGRYLYNTISGETGNKELTQYDLQAGTGSNDDIEKSAVRLTPAAPQGDRYSQLQLGPDGKIYHSIFNWNNIGSGGFCRVGVINSPNTGGAGANYVESEYIWPASATGVGSSMGLTSFHKGFISGRAAITSSLDNLEEVCLGDQLDFIAQSSGSIATYAWNIDKNLNNTVDYMTGPTIFHTYTATGTYTVELVVTDVCGYTYTSTSEVKVLPKTSSAGTVQCSPVIGNVTSPDPSYTYVWYSDAAGTKPIATGATNVSLPVAGSGNVYVRAETGVTSNTSNHELRNTGTKNNWGGSAGNYVEFTVLTPITLNSFNWGNGSIPGWPYPSTTYTVKIQNQDGSVTFYTNSYTTTEGSSTYNAYSESGLNLNLPAGTYRIQYSGTGADWSVSTNASDENVIIGTNAGKVGNFKYTVTKLSPTRLPCSQMSAAIPYSCPLPVELLAFDLIYSGKSVLLKWATSQEVNNNYFEIEKSIDGIHFFNIGKVNGAGNSSQALHYSYNDRETHSGVIYYRIKQVDYDGTFTYSTIKSVHIGHNVSFTIKPNPSNGTITIATNSETASEPFRVEVLDLLGITYFAEEIELVDQRMKVNLQHLPKGLFIVRISGKEEVYTERLVIE